MSAGCIEEQLKQFDVYDQAVDIVSCWECFLDHVYSGVFSDFHFERFPKLPQNAGDPLTPDFTVFFNEDYALIAEIKRTFPTDDDAFESTLDQILKYDQDLGIKRAQGDRATSEVCDLMVILSGSAAPQIGTRINNRLMHDPDYDFDKNLITLRYQYNSSATLSRYEFQRVTEVDHEFRDDPLPSDISLSNSIGEEGNYDTMECYPKHFTPVKVKKPICNDEPPGAYLATILWNKVLPECLDRDQYLRWQQGTVQKTMEIHTTVSEMTDRLNAYMADGEPNESWVEEALNFLCDAELAEENSGQFVVKFRDLVANVQSRGFQEGVQEWEEPKELARMFIQRYCKYSGGDQGSDEPEDDIEEGQSGLADFY